jgi:Na+-driven multidrug efflux pump
MRRIGVICMVSQCIALPVHAWVAIVNMLCAGLGNAKGALALSTSRQGTCFLPILYPLAWIFGAYGIACVQAIADILSLVLAIPIMGKTRRAVDQAEQDWLAQQTQ